MRGRGRGAVSGGAGILLLILALSSGPPLRAGERQADISFDGLVRVEDSVLAEAFVRPHMDLGGYSRILVDPVAVSYKREPTRSASMRASRGRGNFALTEEQMNEFQSLFQEAVTEAMSSGDGWKVVDLADPETLRVHAELIDLVVKIPTRPSTGRQDFFVSEIGSVTLVLELHDSETGRILARAVDRRTIGPERGRLERASGPTARAQARRLFNDWATLLRLRLDQIRDLSNESD